MRHLWTEKIKTAARPVLYRLLLPRREAFDCPICGYHGPFRHKRERHALRLHAKCVQCGAAERHRLLYLVIDDVLAGRSHLDLAPADRRLLHIAPERCLTPRLKQLFGTYHSTDLFRDDVDFKQDIQQMALPDASYDCILVSHVLLCVPDVEAAVREIRRVLKPGGVALFAEPYGGRHTTELDRPERDVRRSLGLDDMLQLYHHHFPQVQQYRSDRYDHRYQLINRLADDGSLTRQRPLQVPGVGTQELVAVCPLPQA